MKPKRVSNNLKQKQIQTKYLQQQTKKMQDKLGELKRQIQQQKKLRTQGLDSTITRWQKTAKTNAPLKSYAKQVLEEQKQVHAQFGINPKKVTGTKAFQVKQLKQEKQQEQQRNPTKITTFLKQQQINQQVQQKTVLENNFFKAKMDVKNLIKQKTLEEFLQQNFILEYLNRFIEEGITDLQSLRYVTRQKLQQLDVKAGHQVKIIKKIKEQFDKMISGKQEQAPPKKTQNNVKIESGYGEGDVNSYREEDIPLNIDSQIVQNNTFNPPTEQNEEDQEQQQRDQVLITVPMRQISLQSQQQTKINCYECYRAINYPDLHYDEKYFCTEICMNKYLSLLKVCIIIYRKIAQVVAKPSQKLKATVKKEYGFVHQVAVQIINKLSRCSFNGIRKVNDHQNTFLVHLNTYKNPLEHFYFFQNLIEYQQQIYLTILLNRQKLMRWYNIQNLNKRSKKNGKKKQQATKKDIIQ